ncbi:MAG: PQQ-binding-like beta-propeller repeat protein [Acidobacteriota bacterium]|nr:PQQ-binding-like beta-propeller repeat protein [Acidobacteriota bacterium]
MTGATAGAQESSAGDFVPVTDAMLQDPAPEDWLSFRRTLDAWGYSPLDQITRENVGRIRMEWTRSMVDGSAETTPLAYDGVLYVANREDVIQALSAETGDLIWEYRRNLPEDIWGYTGPLARKTRNIAIWGEYILGTSADHYAYALDAVTGELAWETRILDYKVNPAHHSAGPIVADGKLISGRSCRPLGGPDACVILAHDAQTGRELWRRRTLPAPGEPGNETWGAVPYEERRHVGTWMPPSYDPELELVYIGTGVTAPAPRFMLGGTDLTHLYHNSTLALDASTGEIRWHYQHLNDSWDLDHVFERILVDTAVAPDPEAVEWINPRLKAGEVRKVVTGIPGKTGLVYTLDRATGEFLWATPTVRQNVITGIDGATGEVSLNEEVIFRELEQVMFICPSWAGGKDWEAGAYSPLTRTMYFPLRQACAEMLATTDFKSEKVKALDQIVAHYALAANHVVAPGTDQLGTVRAISAETGETRWVYETRAATFSLLATGGGLLFGGDQGGRFRALDQETGDVLWQINLGAPVMGFPVTYAVSGRQYVAVNTGPGRLTNARMTPELRPGRGSNLFVFALP